MKSQAILHLADINILQQNSMLMIFLFLTENGMLMIFIWIHRLVKEIIVRRRLSQFSLWY